MKTLQTLFLVGLTLSAVGRGWAQDTQALKREIDDLKTRIAALEQENAKLKSDLALPSAKAKSSPTDIAPNATAVPPSKTETPGQSIFGKSPSDIVKAFYMAANAGKYSEAEQLLDQDARDLIKGPLGQLAGGFKGACDKSTKNGSITNIEVVSESVRGEGATVIVNLHFKDGTSKKDDKNGLILKDGKWWLIIGE